MLDERPPRPLDEQELRALEEIERATLRRDPGLAHRLDGTEGHQHPPVRRTGTPLRWRVVVAVMALAGLYGAVVVGLPPPLALTVVLGVQLVLVPAGCVLWARRRGEL